MGTMPEPRELDSHRVAYGYVRTTKIKAVDIALDDVCAMSWRLSGG
jgi:hypothetical protein